MPLQYLWHTEEGQSQQFNPVPIWNSWLHLEGSVTTCKQMGHINIDVLYLRVCVCLGGGASQSTCIVVYGPYQVQRSLFPFSAWLNFESTSLHVNIHRKLHYRNKGWWQTSAHGGFWLKSRQRKMCGCHGGWTLSLWLNLPEGSNRKAHTPCWRLQAEWGESLKKTAPLIGLSTGTEPTDNSTDMQQLLILSFVKYQSVRGMSSEKHSWWKCTLTDKLYPKSLICNDWKYDMIISSLCMGLVWL